MHRSIKYPLIFRNPRIIMDSGGYWRLKYNRKGRSEKRDCRAQGKCPISLPAPMQRHWEGRLSAPQSSRLRQGGVSRRNTSLYSPLPNKSMFATYEHNQWGCWYSVHREKSKDPSLTRAIISRGFAANSRGTYILSLPDKTICLEFLKILTANVRLYWELCSKTKIVHITLLYFW